MYLDQPWLQTWTFLIARISMAGTSLLKTICQILATWSSPPLTPEETSLTFQHQGDMFRPDVSISGKRPLHIRLEDNKDIDNLDQCME